MHRRLLRSRESGRLSRAKRRPALRLILESLELPVGPLGGALDSFDPAGLPREPWVRNGLRQSTLRKGA